MVDQASGTIEWLDDPGLLSPNEYSMGIYGEDGFQDLLESIKRFGILQPLYVSARGTIISGHRRWGAPRVAYQEGVPVPIPVIRKNYPSELDERQAIIEFNRYRIKTGQQLYNEGKALKEIEAAKAKLRQEATHLVTRGMQQRDMVVANDPLPYAGRTRNIIAKAIGLSCLPRSGRLVPSVIVAPKGEHSAKPELVYEIIERMYPGPYIELFARKRRANWESRGTL
jgi:hypothetical protein